MDGITTLALLIGLLIPRIQSNSDCMDQITMNCTLMDALFHVCNGSKEHAALVCPKTCNLCDYINGKWTEWSDWSTCKSTCGNTTQMRERSCTNPKPSKIGKDCEGPSDEYKPCNLESCPVNGQWSDWEPWSACTTSCGSTTQTQSRTCTNPPPSKNGEACEGSSEESKSCMLEPCPVLVGWGTWGEWGSCSSTCGVGIQNRNRSCIEPIFKRVGDYCVGDTTEQQICMPVACSDGGWATWSSWNTCSVTCGGGFYQRTRDCTNPPPTPFGRTCTGPSSEVETCNTQRCPQTNGGWTDWSSWNTCSAKCGIGKRQRFRDCTNPRRSPLGQPCDGPSVDFDICNTHECSPVRLESGRFEIFLNGQWGTVCDDGFDGNNNAAKVACRMLGLPTSNAMYINPVDGPSSMPIWLDGVICTGNEESLLNCNRNAVGNHNCAHSEDVGVSCG